LPININFTTQSSEVFEPANNFVSQLGVFIFMFVFHMWMRSKSNISASSQRILINGISKIRKTGLGAVTIENHGSVSAALISMVQNWI